MDERRARAVLLAERYPAAAEALLFHAEVSNFRGDWQALRALVMRCGPPMLRDMASRITAERIEAEPEGIFARVLRMQDPRPVRVVETGVCPRCGNKPQCGCWRPEGHGHQLFLVCSCCRNEWSFARTHCSECGEIDENRVVFFQASGYGHIQTRVCETCGKYLHIVHLGQEPAAIPDVDEVAALAVDVWAREQGWEKVYPNLIGI